MTIGCWAMREQPTFPIRNSTFRGADATPSGNELGARPRPRPAAWGRPDLPRCGIRIATATEKSDPQSERRHLRLAFQMRHHLGGEEIHVPTRQIVGQDAELQEGYENAEAGALAHPLDPREQDRKSVV